MNSTTHNTDTIFVCIYIEFRVNHFYIKDIIKYNHKKSKSLNVNMMNHDIQQPERAI